MKTRHQLAASIAAAMCVLPAFSTEASVVFYENEDFGGRTLSADQRIANFQQAGFNDRASSVVVFGERWEVCEDAQFNGRCLILRPGRYPSLASMGMNNRVSSARALSRNTYYDDSRYAPEPYPAYDNRRRKDERVYQANVTSVKAVYGARNQECWVESQRVESGGDRNVGGAVLGAVIGGVLGHQVGGGRGKDVATAVGAITGGVIGSNVGRDGSSTRQIERCRDTAQSGRPAYWDVTYAFRGQEHRVQMSTPPGATVPVNNKGEPRS